jgi:hypothetical protein
MIKGQTLGVYTNPKTVAPCTLLIAMPDNLVEHELVQCPHEWEFLSFQRFITEWFYMEDSGCRCERQGVGTDFGSLEVSE